jgi:DNA-binding MarR family transcriptional regulator
MPMTQPGLEAAKLSEMTSQCACLNARKAARLLSQLYDAALRPAGVRATQLPLLATIALRGPLGVSELAEALAIDRTTLTRSLALLERKKWVRSSPGGDLRTRALSLTPKGQDVVRHAIPLWEQAQALVVATFGKAGAGRIVADFALAAKEMKELAGPGDA